MNKFDVLIIVYVLTLVGLALMRRDGQGLRSYDWIAVVLGPVGLLVVALVDAVRRKLDK